MTAIEIGNARRKTLMNLVRGAALAAMLVPLGAGVAEAGPVTCNTFFEGNNADSLFGGASYACQSLTAVYTQSSTSNTYGFDGGFFSNTLSFDTVLQDMTITMSAFFVTPGNTAFLSRIGTEFEPETFMTSYGEAWVYFRVEDLGLQLGPPEQGTHFEGTWSQDVLWFGDGTYVDPQMLHDNRPLDTFDDVITVDGSFDPEPSPCTDCVRDLDTKGFGDPTIRGGALDFSDTTVVDVTQVPEPSSLVLLASGGIGALYRRRRQRAARAAESL